MKKIIGFILLTVIIAGAGGVWYWNTHKKKIIRDELEKAIREKTEGLYKVHYGNLDLDEVNGHLTVSSFSLTYDSIKLEQLRRDNKEPYLLFNIFIPEINVAGVETPRALIDKEISGRHLTLLNPKIEIIYTNAGKDSSRNVPDKEIYRQILGNLDLIKLDSVIISGADITTKNLKTGRSPVHFANTTLSLFNIAVDSAANVDTTRLLFAKSLDAVCEKFTWHSRNGFYTYQADSLTLRSAASAIYIRDFFIIPALKEDAFARKAGIQTDRFDFALHNIQLINIDFFQLLDESIIADSLFAGPASLKIYRDRTMPPDNGNRVGKYPHQEIQKIPFPLEIKNASIRNTYLEYKEKSSITHQLGRVQLWNSSAIISNITNRPESIAKNNIMVCDMHSRLLNKVPLSVKWTFYLGDNHGRFSIDGKTGGGDATVLNALSIPLGPAEFKSGQINSLSFHMSGTDYKMQGTLKLLYTDFHIALLKKDDDSVHFKRRKVVSLFANMKIKNDNPEKDKPARIANINLNRDTRRSIFNFAWKALFEGIKEVTGVK